MKEQISIEMIAAGGDGLGRLSDGRIVFVPRSAPGDRVEIEILEQHAQWAKARLLGVVEPSADRAEPPCPYYDRCGGCQLQHMTYEAQLQAKSLMVADALRRIGKLDVEPPPVEASPRPLGYRNRVALTLRRQELAVEAGYHDFEHPGEIVDIARCPLAEPPINQVWKTLREAWGPGAYRLPPGPEIRLILRATEDGSVGLAIRGGGDGGEPEALVAQVRELESIWRLDEEGAVDGYAGAEYLEDRWLSGSVLLSGDTFLQVNREVAAKLEAYAMERCRPLEGRTIIDAYCGFGSRSQELAEEGARVLGIDTDGHAIATARAVAEVTEADIRFHAAPVEEILPAALPADLVILNPPRRGVSPEVASSLLEAPPEQVVYVSCDAATLARDLRRFSSGFDLVDLRGFDMFPQTAHVETVASLRRRPDS